MSRTPNKFEREIRLFLIGLTTAQGVTIFLAVFGLITLIKSVASWVGGILCMTLL